MTLPKLIQQQIINLAQKGHQYSAIMRMIPGHPLSRQVVRNTVERWQKRGNLNRKTGSGRPRNSDTPILREKIRRRIRRNPLVAVRKLARDLMAPLSNVQRIVSKDLGLHSYRLRPVQVLSDQNKADRVSRTKELQRRAAAVGWQNVMFSDEKRFDIQQSFNRQNNRILAQNPRSASPTKRKVARAQKPASLLVWAGVSANARTELVFFDDKERLNRHSYIEKVLETQIKAAGDALFGGQPWLFTQDGASCHTANDVQNWLRENNIPFLERDFWPPHSPDINPLDFCVWGVLEAQVCAKPHKSLSSLKAHLKRAWAELDQEVLRSACLSVPKRLKLLLDKKGDHFEI